MNETRQLAVARLMQLPPEINDAEDWIIRTARVLATAQDALTDAESAALISGECDGKNAETRAAMVRARVIAERQAVRAAEQDHMEARSRYSVLQAELTALHAVADLLRGSAS